MSPQLSAVLPLSGWEDFYVIVGSSAAALTGLTFIVITISADRNDRGGDTAVRRLTGLRAFISPTVAHFTASLWISAVLNVPGQTGLSLRVCLAVAGLIGVVYCGRVIYWMVRTFTDSQYTPFLEDWLWNAILPVLAYLSLLGASWSLPMHPVPSLYVVGGVALLLLLVGIHNAWDVVAWITTERHAHKYRHRGLDSPRHVSEARGEGKE
ncbi:MAG TPA: hypothetical protein VN750_16295 [Steroidobacteraceae bacterium]|nr:hypothetical protein [Steroidobacteraceae bacterium]